MEDTSGRKICGTKNQCPKMKIEQNFGISIPCETTKEFTARIGGPGNLRFYEP